MLPSRSLAVERFAKLAAVLAVSLGLGPALEAASEPSPTPTPEAEKADAAPAAVVTSLESAQIADFAANPPAIRALLKRALALTKENLTYKFGSSDPADGGMDCSGTIFHLLSAAGLDDVPRTASGQYVWARKADEFQPVISRTNDTFELDALRPGDLLFWTGTYATQNDPPVTHTMIYLGRLKADGRRVMFGASDGRTYGGKKMWGVSAFDFTIPKARASGSASPGSVFIGYASIPGLPRDADPEKSGAASKGTEAAAPARAPSTAEE